MYDKGLSAPKMNPKYLRGVNSCGLPFLHCVRGLLLPMLSCLQSFWFIKFSIYSQPLTTSVPLLEKLVHC